MFLELTPAARVPRFPGVISSVAVHIIGVLLVVVALPRLPAEFYSDNRESGALQVAWIHLKQPEHLQGKDVADGFARGVKLAELPHSERARNNEPIILQPEFRPEAVMVEALPEVAFWARQAAGMPKPAPSGQAVVPGGIEAPSPPPRLAARPVLAVPNREAMVADINVSMLRVRADVLPALSKPNSATMPIRIRRDTEIVTASFDISSGQPTDVLVLAADRKYWSDLQLPRGLRNVPQIRAGDDGTDNAAGLEMSGGNTSAKRAASRSEITRIEHPPNGRFDVVILQSGGSDDPVGAGAILSGNPVYTVYLGVGDQKEWLLEYCLPADHGQHFDLSQRIIQGGTPIVPPFPISTSIPTSLLGLGATKRIVFHGLLSANGSLEGMSALAADDPLANQILALLSEWRFRPALKDEQAIDVEVLLVVPTRS